ncbi:hypothetical protein GCM10010405_51450 [Streptomyces macrosporus]|uniref:Uncharacterized protein n=1 Tax=Streptomyces macrosporus TaxID=44032 RepID=A0ABN3KI87_9ACTN
MEDRALPVAAYRRTDLTLRKPAPLFGTSESATDRVRLPADSGEGLRRVRGPCARPPWTDGA